MKIGSVLLVEHTPPAVCETCGDVAELRPYGPGKTNVCVLCALKDPANLERLVTEAMTEALVGVTTVVAPDGQVCHLGRPVDEANPRKCE